MMDGISVEPVMVFLLVVASVVGGFLFKSHRRTMQFRDVFGVIDANTYAPEQSQKMVDDILRHYARRSLGYCNQEQTLKQSKASHGNLEKIEVYEEKRLENLIRTSKAAFWHAHGIAKRHAFTVCPRMKDYDS